ncbi:50S ribosomal protein L3 [Mycoplasmoides pneumoniae]|uniref:50S ribosomal protein L3 n=1 Tax=Mycoplasmoides pneumoniae TaxID=2104 RepID=UPI0006BA5528|nr:50S ribosomal protein L3 [Mycoplasmoides pneumoniae]
MEIRGIFGVKVGMSQVFTTNNERLPITVIYCEPNQVAGVKTEAKDKYSATLLSFDTVENKKLNKPQQGFFEKNNLKPTKHLQEIRNMTGFEMGQQITPQNLFQVGEYVDVSAISKGRGFTGAIKRWNFKIGPLGHGAGYPHRFQGSVQAGRGGASAQRVFKGKKMSGHYGHEKVTVQNLRIVGFDEANMLVLVSGAIAGPEGGVVLIRTAKKKPGVVKPIELAVQIEKAPEAKPAKLSKKKQAKELAKAQAANQQTVEAKVDTPVVEPKPTEVKKAAPVVEKKGEDK